MKKKRQIRITLILECQKCRESTPKSQSNGGISRYITSKNRNNNPELLKLRKFCPYCFGHTLHQELSKTK